MSNRIPEIKANRHLSLKPAAIRKTAPEAETTRNYQGIPGIEVIPGGKMFATWYTGSCGGEGSGNYVPLSISTDYGRSWKESFYVVPPDPKVRDFDPCLWVDPQGRLWWFWAQSYSPALWEVQDGVLGVWCSCCEHPEADKIVWSKPRRICPGIMMNKPEIRKDGAWLLPTCIWACCDRYVPRDHKKYMFSNVMISEDNGKTFKDLGRADVPNRSFDEHLVVQLKDGRLWMLVRLYSGIGESFSSDGGKTWTPGVTNSFGGPNSRIALRRLKSGRLLLINHQVPQALPGELGAPEMRVRSKLTAWLSDDDGKTWYGRMMIDPLEEVSYPDFTQDEDGRIYVIYDHARYSVGEIRFACFTEEDVAQGRMVTPGSFLNGLICAYSSVRKK